MYFSILFRTHFASPWVREPVSFQNLIGIQRSHINIHTFAFVYIVQGAHPRTHPCPHRRWWVFRLFRAHFRNSNKTCDLIVGVKVAVFCPLPRPTSTETDPSTVRAKVSAACTKSGIRSRWHFASCTFYFQTHNAFVVLYLVGGARACVTRTPYVTSFDNFSQTKGTYVATDDGGQRVIAPQ